MFGQGYGAANVRGKGDGPSEDWADQGRVVNQELSTTRKEFSPEGVWGTEGVGEYGGEREEYDSLYSMVNKINIQMWR